VLLNSCGLMLLLWMFVVFFARRWILGALQTWEALWLWTFETFSWVRQDVAIRLLARDRVEKLVPILQNVSFVGITRQCRHPTVKTFVEIFVMDAEHPLLKLSARNQ